MEQVLNIFSQYKNPDGLLKSISHSFVFRVLGLLLIYVSQVLLARLMGPKAYGDYTVIITIVNILLAISLFGMDTSALRFIPSALAKKEYGYVHGFIRFTYRLITFISIICSIALFVFLLAKAKKFNISFSEGLFWAVLLLPFLAFIYQASSVLRALQQIKTSMLPIYILLPIAISLGCAYYYNDHNKLTVDAAMMINLICTIGVCIYINKKAGRTVNLLVPEAESISRPGLWTSVSAILFDFIEYVAEAKRYFIRQLFSRKHQSRNIWCRDKNFYIGCIGSLCDGLCLYAQDCSSVGKETDCPPAKTCP